MFGWHMDNSELEAISHELDISFSKTEYLIYCLCNYNIRRTATRLCLSNYRRTKMEG